MICCSKLYYRERHANKLCFSLVHKLADFAGTVADAQGVMQHVLTDRALENSPVFVVTVGARQCAFPLHLVAETLRPLPIEPVAGTPSFVRGMSVIRGKPTPVVDLKALLDNNHGHRPRTGQWHPLANSHSSI
jgi:chemotaxis signal transduction protein